MSATSRPCLRARVVVPMMIGATALIAATSTSLPRPMVKQTAADQLVRESRVMMGDVRRRVSGSGFMASEPSISREVGKRTSRVRIEVIRNLNPVLKRFVGSSKHWVSDMSKKHQMSGAIRLRQDDALGPPLQRCRAVGSLQVDLR